MSDLKRKRVTMKLKHPNPLFLRWLTEWRDKARKDKSKMEYCFTTALKSLKKYPLPLDRGRDCKILKGFGDKLCLMIDNKLKEYETNKVNNLDDTDNENCKQLHGLNQCVNTSKRRKSHISDNTPCKIKKYSNEYFPQEGSGAFAILATLYAQHLCPTYPGFSTKQQIITKGQHLSHTSFSKPDPGCRYTAWSSMGTLIAKNLVIKKSSPAKYSLSDEGLALAKKLLNNRRSLIIDTSSSSYENNSVKNNTSEISGNSDKSTLPQPSIQQEDILSERNYDSSNISCLERPIKLLNDKIIPYEDASLRLVTSSKNEIDLCGESKSKRIKKNISSSSILGSSIESVSEEENFILFPNTFDIILYVDTCETTGNKVFIQDDPILSELTQFGVVYEVKKLTIGDYIWICRDRISKKELVLPFIIERKRMDDFGSSIKDGRYHEQKFRLKKSGIQNITYLIENYGNNQHPSLPITTLHQAATNTAIQDNFSVKFTKNVRDTAKYLANFSTVLIKTFRSKTLASCPRENISEISLHDDLIPVMTFREFNLISSKSRPSKISDLFVKMLIQIRGVSVDKALAIVSKYSTPALLKKAYDENPGVEGEKLLASIQFGDCNKNIGPVLSKIIYQLFTLQSFN